MPNMSVNLQDSFLNHVRKESVSVQVLLSNGTLLEGVVRGFDNFTIVLNIGDKQHMVYKHAIAQLTAPKPVRTHGGESRQRPGARRPPRPANNKKRQPARPEKFNTMDFSRVQIDEKAAAPADAPKPQAPPAENAAPKAAPEQAPEAAVVSDTALAAESAGDTTTT